MTKFTRTFTDAAAVFLVGAVTFSIADSATPPMFDEIARVLQHPRCLNCHTNVDYPKQGNDRHPHLFRVVRGIEDKGVAALPCQTCHQQANNSASSVPGAPNWHAPPLSMGWEGLSSSTLCKTLLDKKKNGGRSPKDIVDHIGNDPLVNWGWNPGGSRDPVPIGKQEYVVLLNRWLAAGAPCPK